MNECEKIKDIVTHLDKKYQQTLREFLTLKHHLTVCPECDKLVDEVNKAHPSIGPIAEIN